MTTYENEFKNYLMDTKRCSKNTLLAYLRDVNQFTDYCTVNGINSIEKADESFR